MVSHTKLKSTNPWIIVLCALSYPNPGYGQQIEHKSTNLTQDMVSQTEQKFTNLWISWSFGHGLVNFYSV